MWARRIKETFAIIAIGDGAIELLAPREHFLLWDAGPAFSPRSPTTCASSAWPR
jgi:hypothetical protein